MSVEWFKRGFSGICSYPHGWITLFLQAVAIAATYCSINIMWSCQYLNVVETIPLYGNTTSLTIGFLRREPFFSSTNTDDVYTTTSSSNSVHHRNPTVGCVAWQSNVDGAWIAGRVFSIMAASLAVISLIMIVCFMTCYILSQSSLRGCAWILWLAAILDVLTMILALTSSQCQNVISCHPGSGFHYAIAASVLLLFTGCLVRSIPPPGGTGHSNVSLQNAYIPAVPDSIHVPENV